MNIYPVIPAAEAFKLISLQAQAIIDVRSEAEYLRANFQHTINLPILSDLHRHQVGLIYKLMGSEQAVKLGHTLVSGSYKATMIENWCAEIANYPQTPALIFCWRGGLRSKLAQEWIYQQGSAAIRIESGYKALRLEALKELENPKPFIILSGMTGAGKTRLLLQLHNFVDIEGIARHRGSAFGTLPGENQPAQATFENYLAQAFNRVASQFVLEDESPNIGRCHLPDQLYARMAQAPMVIIDTPVALRAQEIYLEYIQIPLSRGMLLVQLEHNFMHNLEKIRNRLGGLECDNLKSMLKQAFIADASGRDSLELHQAWIARLLTLYYDKRYLYSLSLKARTTLFKGSWESCRDYLNSIM